jgi:hypothetical protein
LPTPICWSWASPGGTSSRSTGPVGVRADQTVLDLVNLPNIAKALPA